MSERVRVIKFKHFRGLPENEFKLKGKNLVLLGANGKGKSALVDGIEFLFSGNIARLKSTKSISYANAVKNVSTKGDPEVVLALSPSNNEISRKFSSDSIDIIDNPAVKEFFNQHSTINGFVLRRSRILEFIFNQDADRYQKFVNLLGIEKTDRLQRTFINAESEAKTEFTRVQGIHTTKIAAFNDPALLFIPTNLDQVLAHVNKAIEAFELEKLAKWKDAETRLHHLKAKRPKANSEEIDTITRALVSVEAPLDASPEADVKVANILRLKLAELTDSSVDAPRSKIIDEGRNYFTTHSDDDHCPLCETEFKQPIEVLLNRLNERSDALQEFRNSESERGTALGRIKQYVDNIASRLMDDLMHSVLFDADSKASLKNAHDSAIQFSQLVDQASRSDLEEDLTIPAPLLTVPATRSALAIALKEKKEALVLPDSSQLESAIALLERGIASWEDIETAEQAVATKKEILRRTTVAKDSFSSARKESIQHVFNRISNTVLDYYKRLHDFDGGDEVSECTALELKTTDRSASGGLQLVIQFLGLVNNNDPRAFLSDGHLDSLGLCLFLAAARIFNPPGSLLVLDDVLTSIDKEHRRRVGELLYSEFQDSQIILTTHDEHWYNLLRSTATAQGIQNKWRYVHLESWMVATGPTLSVSDSSWAFINNNLTEEGFRNLGGPFRVVAEDFMKRSAEKIQLKVRFKTNGNYTIGDFVTAGIENKIRDKLIELDSKSKDAVRIDVGRVFGQGDLINVLSHDNTNRLEITLDQAKDFSSGLCSLMKRCEKHQLIKGR